FTLIDTQPFYPLHPEINITPCFTKIEPSGNLLNALKSNFLIFRRLRSLLLKNRVELVVAFMTTANILAILAGKIIGIPVIISERNNPKKQDIAGYWKVLRLMTYPFADFLVVQTAEIRQYFTWKISKKRLHILPNPISPELTQNRISGVKKQNIILSIGSLTKQKAQHVLVKAFALTKAENWQLVIVGEGPIRVKLEKLIQDLGIQGNVSLPGEIKDIYKMYSKSKIFAFSSLYEGFPNALIESMHFGLPCISTNCPTGPSELINDSKNGYLVPMNDEKAMAEKLSVLMNDENKRKSFGDKAIKTVEIFEIKNVVVQWKALIENCISN
ncbi:MAG: glycosyltransferase family 4 protein, partial [Maribacter sp.]